MVGTSYASYLSPGLKCAAKVLQGNMMQAGRRRGMTDYEVPMVYYGTILHDVPGSSALSLYKDLSALSAVCCTQSN
jgi:hypothetical protein